MGYNSKYEPPKHFQLKPTYQQQSVNHTTIKNARYHLGVIFFTLQTFILKYINPQKLNYEQIKQGLYNLFRIHGSIYDITIKIKENGSHFAFVDYLNLEDAQNALKVQCVIKIDQRKRGKFYKIKSQLRTIVKIPRKMRQGREQNVFYAFGSGHKAKNCPVKPYLIKTPKKNSKQSNKTQNQIVFSIEQSGFRTKRLKVIHHLFYPYHQNQSQIDRQSQWSIGDKDYLRFLKLKKKMVEKKLKKKIVKNKRKRF